MKTSDKVQSKGRPDADKPLDKIVKELFDIIDNDDSFCIGALLALYSFQTEDERANQNTLHSNNMGFNGIDARTLSNIAEWYKKTGFLSIKQLAFVRRSLKKYHRQLLAIKINPAPIKSKAEKKESNAKSVMKVDLSSDGRLLEISFNFPKGDARFYDVLKQVKTIQGRKFIKAKSRWEAPLYLLSLKMLMEWGFEISEGLQQWHDSMVIGIDDLFEYQPERLLLELYPFQKIGISFLQATNGNAIIGDEMGLGKTAQALGWLSMNTHKAFPAVVICPASLKYNWEREIKKWLGDEIKVQIISGRPNSGHTALKPNQDIYVINYDIVANQTMEEQTNQPGRMDKKKERIEIPGTGWVDFLPKIKPKTIILDEFHYIKNSKAQRTKAIKKLAKECDHVIGLSGTPIINRPVEFFNGIELINPQLFPGWWYYVHQFCGAYNDGWGMQVNGASNTEQLHKILTSTIMVRRKKAEVLEDLPAKTRSIVPLYIDPTEYKRAEEDIIEWIAEKEGNKKADQAAQAEQLVRFEALKQLAVNAKMDEAIEWIKAFLESDEKLIVFADHKFVIEHLMKNFKKIAVKIDGRVPNHKRMNAVDKFQNDPECRLFIGSKAAKEGLTLTAASNVAFMEFWWTPLDHDQAEDRCYGRLSDIHGANIYYLVALGTIEEKIAELLDKKRKVLDAVLDGKSIEEAPSVLTELIKEMKHG